MSDRTEHPFEPHEQPVASGDQELLATIDTIITGRTLPDRAGDEGEGAHDLVAFAALVARTVPLADTAFHARLDEQIPLRLEQQRSEPDGLDMSVMQQTDTVEPARLDLDPRGQRRSGAGLGRAFKHMAVGIAAAMLFILLLMILIPDLRTASAAELRKIAVGISSRPGGVQVYSPPPPFVVFQLSPDRLPVGFAVTWNRYAPGSSGNGLVMTGGAPVRVGSDESTIHPVAERAAQRNWGPDPHIVIVYESNDGRYLILFERKAAPDESLPPGEPRTVAGNPARLDALDQGIRLTWVDAGTRIEIESSLPEQELLALAAQVKGTQIPGERNPLEALFMPHEPVFCDPNQKPPSGVLLGKVSGQKNRGSVRIEFQQYPNRPDMIANLSSGANVPDIRGGVYEPALAALQNPAIPLQRLPYAAVSTFSSSESVPCLVPSSVVKGYLVIEVWEQQVNIGYGGNGAAMRERGIQALLEEIKKQK